MQRLALRGGVKAVDKLHDTMRAFLETVLPHAMENADYRRHKTIDKEDVLVALWLEGHRYSLCLERCRQGAI